MAARELLGALREVDVGALDFDNIGAWPTAAKAAVCALALLAVLLAGYFYYLRNLRLQLQLAVAQERELKHAFEGKARQAASLHAWRRRMLAVEGSFGALLSQLPGAGEAPELLEDITRQGSRSGLEIDRITPQPELVREFHIELPIHIGAHGSYHEIGAFISGMASLSRIVTLHDFVISRRAEGGALLDLEITAKTYRYRQEEPR